MVRGCMRALRAAALLPLLGLTACGGEGPMTPPPPTPTHPVPVVVFYDVDADGVADPDEIGRVPGVEVTVAGRSATSATGNGYLVVNGVPEGVHTASVRMSTLPAFYQTVPGVTVTVRSPATEEAFLGLTLAIGVNNPYTYMGFGDSITVGDGSSDGDGYRVMLEALLAAHFGDATVYDEGISGTRSDRGAQRIGGSLDRRRPAYTLVLYGTNDWNDSLCDEAETCFTLESVRSIVRDVKAAESLPVVGTIPPINVGYDFRTPESRQDWVNERNEELRAMAREEGALLGDINAALVQASGGDIGTVIEDHVHPNDRGYEIMADTWFAALARPLPAAPAATLFKAPAAPPARGQP